jgi:DNA-binding response OmpR family regulator
MAGNAGNAGKTKGRILIADDDPHIVSMLSLRYTKSGYEVLEAQDGHDALRKVRTERPELVILDVMMPGKNGWEVARELRHDEETKHVGILVLTAIGAQMNEMTSPLYGADDFIDKPFEFAELDKKVQTILNRRRKAQAHV